MRRSKLARFAAVLIALHLLAGCAAQPAFRVIAAYPAYGQTTEQATKDKTECEAWARQEIGYNPGGEAAGGAAAGALIGALVGAAGGAAIGAAAGSPGKGAAIGAAAGGVGGAGVGAASQYKKTRRSYLSAYANCMLARGYSVGGRAPAAPPPVAAAADTTEPPATQTEASVIASAETKSVFATAQAGTRPSKRQYVGKSLGVVPIESRDYLAVQLEAVETFPDTINIDLLLFNLDSYNVCQVVVRDSKNNCYLRDDRGKDLDLLSATGVLDQPVELRPQSRRRLVITFGRPDYAIQTASFGCSFEVSIVVYSKAVSGYRMLEAKEIPIP